MVKRPTGIQEEEGVVDVISVQRFAEVLFRSVQHSEHISTEATSLH